MSLKIIALLCLCVPSVAQAEWRFEAHYGASGRALGFGSGGQTLTVECRNGGYPALLLIGPRPVGGAMEDYVLRVDSGTELLIGAECGSDGCAVMFETARQVRDLMQGIRAGNMLSVGFFRSGLGGEISLSGAGAAIDQVMSAGCEVP